MAIFNLKVYILKNGIVLKYVFISIIKFMRRYS